MAILKIRDADGNIKSIAIMKGDKGDNGVGIPDGGTTGQTIKRTEIGAEWVDPYATPAVVMSNTDTSVASATITQRGLYEVDVAYFLGSKITPAPLYSEYEHKVFLISVGDMSKTQKDKYVAAFDSKVIGIDGMEVKENVPRIVTLTYENGAFSSEHFMVGHNDLNRTCIAEVKLIIPYA